MGPAKDVVTELVNARLPASRVTVGERSLVIAVDDLDTQSSNSPAARWFLKVVKRVLLDVHRGHPIESIELSAIAKSDFWPARSGCRARQGRSRRGCTLRRRSISSAKWSASRPDLTWPAACDPSKPRATLKRKVVITFAGESAASALLMVRINPAAEPAAKGRFMIGRALSVA